MSKPSPGHSIEIDGVALDLFVMDKQEGSIATQVGIVWIRDSATGFISGFSIVEEDATNEQDASLSLQNLDYSP